MFRYFNGNFDLLTNVSVLFSARTKEDMQNYLDKYVYGVKNHEEYVELCGGEEHMATLCEAETIKEGYHA